MRTFEEELNEMFSWENKIDDLDFFPQSMNQESSHYSIFKTNAAFREAQESDPSLEQTKALGRSASEEKYIDDQLQPLNLPETNQKSPFHNFQKHLIAIIKRTSKIDYWRQDSVVCQLWNAFKNTRSVNKRVLHTVFGMKNASDQQLYKLGQEFKKFSDLIKKHSSTRIVMAQQKLRSLVVAAAEKISKQTFKTSCQVSRFQEFYEYYISLIAEIREGPLDRRMTKARKNCVMQNVSDTRLCQ